MEDCIETGRETLSKKRLNALLEIRAVTLDAIREQLQKEGYLEVTTSSLVNAVGSCANPSASFILNYGGREAYLSQSAQFQLESLVLRLRRPVFTINHSFRGEQSDDPGAKGRRLSEFTLIEVERPYLERNVTVRRALDNLMGEQQKIIVHVLEKILSQCREQINLLGPDNIPGYGTPAEYLGRVYLYANGNFGRLTYDQALEILNEGELVKRRGKPYVFGDDLGMAEEKALLHHNEGIPLFIADYPASLKFFNMKRTEGGKRVYNADLLLPPLGETFGGAVREEDGKKIKQQLLESRVGELLHEKGLDPLEQFKEYLHLFEQEQQEQSVLRAGYGLGFERLVAFLIGTNDILHTVAYRSM